MLSEEYKEYWECLNNIFSKIKILKKRDLINALCNNFIGITEGEAEHILVTLQARERLIITKDGYVLTKPMYYSLTGDWVEEKLNVHGKVRMQADLQSLVPTYYTKYIECMPVVIDLMPDSNDFMVGRKPWLIQFIVEDDEGGSSKLYQITRVKKGSEVTEGIILRNLKDKLDAEERDSIRRIVVMEDPELSWRIPYVGITHIVTNDDTESTGYRIVEDRTKENIWKDYVEE